jgi:sugar phosphate isomerase/epimerase
LDLAARLGATVLEILPDWKSLPCPLEAGRRAGDAGFRIHSAHGCWGGTTITAARVDLGSTDPATWQASLDELKRCLDWLADAGGRCLVVHPGGLSDPDEFPRRREALCRGLWELADHATACELFVCVENMPPGVHPGSRMGDLVAILAELDRPELGLALDTGHAQLVASPASETRAAGSRLRTTHVHDNNGQDTHDPPGHGAIDWGAWAESLDLVDYDGPIILECIRAIRQEPGVIDERFLALLGRLTRRR